jgi:hypothetical protein
MPAIRRSPPDPRAQSRLITIRDLRAQARRDGKRNYLQRILDIGNDKEWKEVHFIRKDPVPDLVQILDSCYIYPLSTLQL